MIFIRDYVILLLRHNLRFTNWLLPKTFSKNKNSKLRSPTLHKGEKKPEFGINFTDNRFGLVFLRTIRGCLPSVTN